MLDIVVVGNSAESRSRLVSQIDEALHINTRGTDYVPAVSLKPLSVQELKFHSSPHICIVSEDIVAKEPGEIRIIRETVPDAKILVRIDSSMNRLSIVEQVARMGADDVIDSGDPPEDLLRKLIILSRKSNRKKTGTLIVVDSGKGGSGVTSFTAGIGEALLARGNRVVLLDFDFETQDLSRFLQARPYVNENLQLLFDESRPITLETIEQCLVPVWAEDPTLYCMPPVAEAEGLYDAKSVYPRILMSVLEVLDSEYDYVIVDSGSARGSFLRTLYRVADHVLYLVNNDPASVYACVDRLTKGRSWMAADAGLLVVENALARSGLSQDVLKGEFLRAARLKEEDWFNGEVPFCKHAYRWPGSGGTMYSQAREPLAKAIDSVLAVIGGDAAEPGAKGEPVSAVIKKFASRFSRGGPMQQPGAGEESPEDRPLLEDLRGLPAGNGDAYLPAEDIVSSLADEARKQTEDMQVDLSKLVSGVKIN